MNVYCNNCGIKGHVYRDCLSPILSCGVILCKKINDKYNVLMINRKDSLCYIDFLRGKYKIEDIEYIKILLNKITIKEKEKLLKMTFDELWVQLWNLSELTDVLKEKNDYREGSKKYELLKNGFDEDINLEGLISGSDTGYKESEWEFPKGRRNKHEKNRDCAIREVKEETNYSIQDYDIINNMVPLTEEFMGENGIRYKYIYYVGIVLNSDKPCILDKGNIFQRQEISDLKWLNESDALNKLRDYHKSREILIKTIYSLLNEIEKDVIFL